MIMLSLNGSDHGIKVLPCSLGCSQPHNIRVLVTLELAALCQLGVLVSKKLADSFEHVVILVSNMTLCNKETDLLVLLKKCLFLITLNCCGLYVN
jgi:hypothetical protein